MDLCAADGGARKASIGASVEYAEALIEDAYRVVHVGWVVVGVIALAGGEARLKIWLCFKLRGIYIQKLWSDSKKIIQNVHKYKLFYVET